MRPLFTVLVWFFSLAVRAQTVSHAAPAASASPLFANPDYPQHYFRDPLDIPISLAANFGELRPGHYHMGLDIRTQHRENLPVYAAADGYIARVQIGPFGFGQAIYIRHPDGYTTVYGHLNRFSAAVAAYVEQQQYLQQSWQVDLTIPPGLFPVRQGQQIAWSGNTGGSQGPHLHFEIRQTAGDVNLNPLLFGLPVEDRVAPKISWLGWYDGNEGIYDQRPHIFPVRSGGLPVGAVLTVPVTRIRFSISASDAQSGSFNPNGIYRAVLYDGDRALIGFQLDSISYKNTRNINAHIDYKTRILGGPFLQQLFFLSGYPFPSIYRVPGPGGGVDPARGGSVDPARGGGVGPTPGGGVGRAEPGLIDLRDGLPHHIRIEVSDTRGNRTSLVFAVQYRAGVNAPGMIPGPSGPPGSAADTGGGKAFYPGMVDGQEATDYAFFLGERSLYDSAHIGVMLTGYPGSGLSLPGGVTPVYTIGARWIPLLEPVLVRLRLPDSSGINAVGISAEPAAQTARVVMVCFEGDEKDVQLPEWRGSWASARFGEFGNFQLVCDTVPPVITPVGPLVRADLNGARDSAGADLSHADRIAFRIRDNLGALRNFRAELDGRWICFTNDKGLAYIYKIDEHCAPGPHVLKVAVEDVAGNRTVEEYHFKR